VSDHRCSEQWAVPAERVAVLATSGQRVCDLGRRRDRQNESTG